MNVFGGNYPRAFSAALTDPQDGGQYRFRITGESGTFIGVFRWINRPPSAVNRSPIYNVLMLVPSLAVDGNVYGPSDTLPPELQPTDTVRRLCRSEVTIFKQLYISFTSRYTSGELEFRNGMEGPHHISDEHTGMYSSLLSCMPSLLYCKLRLYCLPNFECLRFNH